MKWCSIKKTVLRNFTIFTPVLSLFFNINAALQLYNKDTPTQVVFLAILQNF